MVATREVRYEGPEPVVWTIRTDDIYIIGITHVPTLGCHVGTIVIQWSGWNLASYNDLKFMYF